MLLYYCKYEVLKFQGFTTDFVIYSVETNVLNKQILL